MSAQATVSAVGGLAPLQLLRETAGRSPRAVIFAEDAGNTDSSNITTAQALVELADARLDAYRRAGIGPGCRVGAVAWPAASFTADVLAVLALDAVVVPLPRQMSEWERERTEALAAPTHVTAPLDWPLLPGAGDVMAGRRLIVRKEATGTRTGAALGAGAASAQLTSGTSGNTKVALRPVSALLTEAENYRAALDLAPGTVLACPVPLHHAYGFGLAALAAPLAGATTFVTSVDRPRMLLRALEEHNVTLFAGVPPMLRLLAEAATSRPTRRIGYLTAGMPLDSRTAELVGTVLGGWIGEVYGTTETGPICVRPPGPWENARSLGSPLPGVRVEIRPTPMVRSRSRRRAMRPRRGRVSSSSTRRPRCPGTCTRTGSMSPRSRTASRSATLSAGHRMAWWSSAGWPTASTSAGQR